MIVIDGTALDEPWEFGRLSVRLTDPVGTVGDWARPLPDDHVAVAPALLLELAGPLAADPEWRAGLDAMLAYAGQHGWLEDDGWVRIHVER
ncbi:hypothetical protein G5V58_08690 [Nocardioides anomalus]|uniref:Uncharacterized protein n=1 Tax=Nocardioides anomalus TaxID=2712223 RepID=A0A6G6WCA0_9ACTN|nr:hypothetical protein [Nocardioides anomalus]QIG42836.1 hypothetical protein G5V58_08690 [Nocardioides anomalus]